MPKLRERLRGFRTKVGAATLLRVRDHARARLDVAAKDFEQLPSIAAATLLGLAVLIFFWVIVAVSGGGIKDLGAFSTVIVGVPAAYIALCQLKVTRDRHEAQTEADTQRRITESFTKAAEQLGSSAIAVRLGGIYTLERISRESPDDYWTVMETLTAFVRERVPWKAPDPAAPDSDHHSGLPTDVDAVLAVIKRRGADGRAREREQFDHLDLHGADLRKASLATAHLEGANLTGVHFEEASLAAAHLQGAILTAAHLEGAYLNGTHLERAYLRDAHLEGAHLEFARLEGAHLLGAHLEGAILANAHLEGAFLEEAVGITPAMLEMAYGDALTILPKGLQRPAHWPAHWTPTNQD